MPLGANKVGMMGASNAATVPDAPGTLSLSEGGTPATQIDLSWSAPSSDGGADITGYKIQHSTNGSSWSTLVADTSSTGTTYTATSLTRLTQYWYRVAAINEKGTGDYGNEPDRTTTAEVPGAPGTLSLSAGTDDTTQIDLSWSAPSDAGGGTISGYKIQISTNGSSWSDQVADTSSTGTTYTASSLTDNTQYWFRVAGINEIGTGAYGNEPDRTTVEAFTATGGTTNTYTGYKSHTFTSTGSFTVTGGSHDVDVLVIAGGGGGGMRGAMGGGGGAGGYRTTTSVAVSSTGSGGGGVYTVTIGGGGAGTTTTGNGSTGTASSWDTGGTDFPASGGGFGNGDAAHDGGGDGGSGGGGSATYSDGGDGNAGSYDPVEGYDGGNGAWFLVDMGGAGGGSSEAGNNGNFSGGTGAAGGDGAQNDYRTGSNEQRGGGGGAPGQTGPGSGGAGGGGNASHDGAAGSGTAYTGSGGGGTSDSTSSSSGAGGSGTVIVRYTV